jgi:hypothetical protein
MAKSSEHECGRDRNGADIGLPLPAVELLDNPASDDRGTDSATYAVYANEEELMTPAFDCVERPALATVYSDCL